jgi:hypothetical protein
MAHYERMGIDALDVTMKFIVFCLDLNIVDNTSVRRLGWVGHITRMQDETVPQRRFLMEKSRTQDR